MKYRLLGRTGMLVSEICLGTMTFGGSGGFWSTLGALQQETATALVKASLEAGINFIDTANVYAAGESEALLGGALKSLGVKRSDVVLATKVRGRMGPGVNTVGLTRGHIMSSVKDSLARLQTDYIDLYQIHGVDPLTPIDETLRALDDLVRSGMVRYIGCSNMMAWQIMKALGISGARELARFESLQAYYSIAGRDLEREILPMLDSENLGLMVWSPLAGGFLSGKFRRDQPNPEGARRANLSFPPVDVERAYDIIDVMVPIAEAHGTSVARVALAWVLGRQGVTSIIVGAKTEAQLHDNIAAGDLVLTEQDWDALDAVSSPKPEYPRWMIDTQSPDRLKSVDTIPRRTPPPQGTSMTR